MNTVTLTRSYGIDDCPFPFFQPEYYKIYNDGGHYVATPVFHSAVKRRERRGKRSTTDEALKIAFDSIYYQAQRERIKHKALPEYIKVRLLKLFFDTPELDKFIEKNIERMLHNAYARKKRFRRKAHLNRWNYFVTFTYDDKKHTAETFRAKLRKCLSNLHTRRGWRYMGVFEHAPDTGRLHFHGLLYVPDGQMIGKVMEIKDYSTAQGKMQITHSNSFFADSFGRNDFSEINGMELKQCRTLEYILKYIGKTGERIVYSRGIATEVCKPIKERDIITHMKDFVDKFILFDNVIDWERDIMHYTKRKQLSIIDLLCNPPQTA